MGGIKEFEKTTKCVNLQHAHLAFAGDCTGPDRNFWRYLVRIFAPLEYALVMKYKISRKIKMPQRTSYSGARGVYKDIYRAPALLYW